MKSRSEEAMRAKLRGGAGPHEDSRTARARTRSEQRRIAIQEGAQESREDNQKE